MTTEAQTVIRDAEYCVRRDNAGATNSEIKDLMIGYLASALVHAREDVARIERMAQQASFENR